MAATAKVCVCVCVCVCLFVLGSGVVKVIPLPTLCWVHIQFVFMCRVSVRLRIGSCLHAIQNEFKFNSVATEFIQGVSQFSVQGEKEKKLKCK